MSLDLQSYIIGQGIGAVIVVLFAIFGLPVIYKWIDRRRRKP